MKEIFSGGDGRLSSKRILGAITLLFSLVLTVVVIVTKYDHNVLFYPYCLAGGLLGAGVLENIGKQNNTTGK